MMELGSITIGRGITILPSGGSPLKTRSDSQTAITDMRTSGIVRPTLLIHLERFERVGRWWSFTLPWDSRGSISGYGSTILMSSRNSV